MLGLGLGFRAYKSLWVHWLLRVYPKQTILFKSYSARMGADAASSSRACAACAEALAAWFQIPK